MLNASTVPIAGHAAARKSLSFDSGFIERANRFLAHVSDCIDLPEMRLASGISFPLAGSRLSLFGSLFSGKAGNRLRQASVEGCRESGRLVRVARGPFPTADARSRSQRRRFLPSSEEARYSRLTCTRCTYPRGILHLADTIGCAASRRMWPRQRFPFINRSFIISRMEMIASIVLSAPNAIKGVPVSRWPARRSR